MANTTTGKVLRFEEAGSKSGILRVRLIQWVCDAGDIVDGNTLDFTLGENSNITTLAKIGDDTGQQSCVVYEAGPFNPGLKFDGITVTTITKGELLVWLS